MLSSDVSTTNWPWSVAMRKICGAISQPETPIRPIKLAAMSQRKPVRQECVEELASSALSLTGKPSAPKLLTGLATVCGHCDRGFFKH